MYCALCPCNPEWLSSPHQSYKTFYNVQKYDADWMKTTKFYFTLANGLCSIGPGGQLADISKNYTPQEEGEPWECKSTFYLLPKKAYKLLIDLDLKWNSSTLSSWCTTPWSTTGDQRTLYITTFVDMLDFNTFCSSWSPQFHRCWPCNHEVYVLYLFLVPGRIQFSLELWKYGTGGWLVNQSNHKQRLRVFKRVNLCLSTILQTTSTQEATTQKFKLNWEPNMNFLVDVVDLSKQFTFFPVNQATAQIVFSTQKVTPLIAIFIPCLGNLQTSAWGDFVLSKHVRTQNTLQLYTQY